jgi:hypothetical protein
MESMKIDPLTKQGRFIRELFTWQPRMIASCTDFVYCGLQLQLNFISMVESTSSISFDVKEIRKILLFCLPASAWPNYCSSLARKRHKV